MNRIIIFATILCLLAVSFVATVFFWSRHYLASAQSSDTESVVFEIRSGESFKSVAQRLEASGLVDNARAFEISARLSGESTVMRVGEYSLKKSATPQEMLAVLSSGRSLEYPIVIREGFNRFEIAEIVEKAGIASRQEFLKLTLDRSFIREVTGQDLPSLEGYLFPETYRVTKFTGVKAFIKMMIDRFKENISQIKPATSIQLSQHELVTLASIIEKETGAPEERPVISSVFHNRLRLRMRLQTDPTVIYGIWEQQGEWNRNLTRADLLTPTRYNTYTAQGLPYGPIANPGLLALQAAAAPAESEFLFFVSRNDGTHVFSRDYSDHKNAVQQFQIDRKAREGKSWRDLSRRAETPEKVADSAPRRDQRSPRAKSRASSKNAERH